MSIQQLGAWTIQTEPSGYCGAAYMEQAEQQVATMPANYCRGPLHQCSRVVSQNL